MITLPADIYPAKKSVKFWLDQEWLYLKYTMLSKEIILKTFDDFQNEIQGFSTKLSAFKVPRAHPSKDAKLPLMSMEQKTWSTLIICERFGSLLCN